LGYLLFPAYLILFTWLVTRIKFFKRSGLSGSQLIIFFLLKVLAGIFYGWIGYYYSSVAQMVDTWSFHYAGIGEYRLLLSNPQEWLAELFRNHYHNGVSNFFGSYNSYWNDLKANFFIKILSVCNLFSFGNYYVNVIFFSFVSLFGPIAVYRVMIDVFPGKQLQVLLAIFFIPSFLYWSSGIHKDGLLFTCIAMIVYHVYFGLKEKSFKLKRWLIIFLSLVLIVILRNFLMMALLPAIVTWIIASRYNKKSLAIFFAAYLLFGFLFFFARHVSPYLDFPRTVSEKQTEFMQMQGGSAVPVTQLQPTVKSFLVNIPQALDLALLRPYPSDVKHLLSLAAAVEIDIILVLVVLFLIFRRKEIRSRNFFYFCIFFSATLLLSVGYTVNFLGAIVRYRSIVFPFLLAPLVCLIDWQKINNIVSKRINKKNNVSDSTEIPSKNRLTP
jgi:hypothetical protein